MKRDIDITCEKRNQKPKLCLLVDITHPLNKRDVNKTVEKHIANRKQEMKMQLHTKQTTKSS